MERGVLELEGSGAEEGTEEGAEALGATILELYWMYRGRFECNVCLDDKTKTCTLRNTHK